MSTLEMSVASTGPSTNGNQKPVQPLAYAMYNRPIMPKSNASSVCSKWDPHARICICMQQNEVGGGGSVYLGGSHFHATVDAAEDFIMLLKAGSLCSRQAEAGSGAGGYSEVGRLDGGGGGGGGEVGEGGALHLLHAVVTTVVVVVILHGTNAACLQLQSVTSC